MESAGSLPPDEVGTRPRPSRLHALSTRAKLDIAAQVADALAAAAKAGVIHQDVKPENILVDESAPPLPSGAPRVKLADFGVGRVVNEEMLGKLTLTGIGKSIVLTTRAGSDTGTLLYMAPERLEGKPATLRSDLYSLGVVLFQMIAGDLDRAVTLDGDTEVTDPTLRADLRRTLSGTPERRIGSAEELAGRLRSWSRRRATRNLRRTLGFGVAAMLLVVATAGWFLTKQIELQRQADAADRVAVQERGLRAEAETAKARAETAESTAKAQKRRFQAEAEHLKAERDENAGDRMSALAHAVASVRIDPAAQAAGVRRGGAAGVWRGSAADAAWRLRVPTARLLWTTPSTVDDNGQVTSVAFSPDGTRIVSGSDDNTIRLWEAATGKEVSRLEGHTGAVSSVAFSPDGTRIVSGSWDNTIRLWAAATGKEVWRCGGHAAEVESIAFSPDGRRVASLDSTGCALVWDTERRLQVRDISPEEARRLHDTWSVAEGPREPTRLPHLGAVILEGESEWRLAWRDAEKDENGLPRKVGHLLDQWERDIGMRVNLDTGALERLPTPGPAYASDPEIAPRCK
ncbi:MAG: protein kinase [Planctomycetes bacterium]|nr:protein kinase [Planctomycetota bacterium]